MTGIRRRSETGTKLVFILFLTVMWIPFAGQIKGFGAAPGVGELDGWKNIEEFLAQSGGGVGQSFSFAGLVETLMSGQGREAGRMLLDAARAGLFGELEHGGHMVGQLLALGLLGAVFANFSEIFSGGQMAQTGFFITYLLAFAVLASSFFDSVAIAGQVLEKQILFMRALLPAYFAAVVWSGAGVASAAWYELLLFLIGGVQWIYGSLLVPLVRIYILLVLAGHMAKEDMLSKLTDLLKTVIQWGTRSLITLVLGFQLIQGMVLPYADAVKTAGVQKLLQAIPGIGAGAGAVTKLILGSSVLIKNTMGAAAVAVLVLLTLVPVVKLVVLLFLYRGVAAVLEPVADKRLVSCISGVADAQRLILGIVISSLLLFVITIALICLGTNVSYLA